MNIFTQSHTMGKAIKIQIVKIGDSQGVFIPKTLL